MSQNHAEMVSPLAKIPLNPNPMLNTLTAIIVHNYKLFKCLYVCSIPVYLYIE